MRKGLKDLVGHTIEHKVFGNCEVLEIINEKEGKFIGKVERDNAVKKLVFSAQYFVGLDEFKTVKIEVKKPVEQKREYKKVDLSKYRNHPLVKEIDRKEAKIKKLLTLDDEDDDAEDIEAEE